MHCLYVCGLVHVYGAWHSGDNVGNEMKIDFRALFVLCISEFF